MCKCSFLTFNIIDILTSSASSDINPNINESCISVLFHSCLC